MEMRTIKLSIRKKINILTLDLWGSGLGGVRLEVVHIGGRDVCVQRINTCTEAQVARLTFDEEDHKQGGETVIR